MLRIIPDGAKECPARIARDMRNSKRNESSNIMDFLHRFIPSGDEEKLCRIMRSGGRGAVLFV